MCVEGEMIVCVCVCVETGGVWRDRGVCVCVCVETGVFVCREIGVWLWRERREEGGCGVKNVYVLGVVRNR